MYIYIFFLKFRIAFQINKQICNKNKKYPFTRIKILKSNMHFKIQFRKKGSCTILYFLKC